MIFILRIILCEDDQQQVNINQDYIRNIAERMKEECEIRQFLSPEDINDEDIEWGNVALLDIDFGIGEITGIQLARRITRLNKWIAIVFVTAYKEYTSEAYQLQAIGYLEKPIIRYELENMLEKVVRYVGKEYSENFLNITHDKKNIIVRQQDIVYVEKLFKKSIITTLNDEIDTYENIGSLEQRLSSDFIRINQGVIINRTHICKVEDEMAWLSTGKGFKISRSRKKQLEINLLERR